MQNTLTEKAAEMAEQALVVKALVRIPSGLADARTPASPRKPKDQDSLTEPLVVTS